MYSKETLPRDLPDSQPQTPYDNTCTRLTKYLSQTTPNELNYNSKTQKNHSTNFTLHKICFYLTAPDPKALYDDLANAFGCYQQFAFGKEIIVVPGLYFRCAGGYYPVQIQYDASNAGLSRRMNSIVAPYLTTDEIQSGFSKVELCLNIPFCDYSEAEENLIKISNALVPTSRHKEWKDIFNDERIFDDKGQTTLYFQTFISEKNIVTGTIDGITVTHQKAVDYRTKTRQLKSYTKMVDEAWCVHIETTLSGWSLKKFLGKPTRLDELEAALARLPTDSFFHFEEIDFSGFCKQAKRIARKKCSSKNATEQLYAMIKAGREFSQGKNVQQVITMREIADFLGSIRLKNSISTFRKTVTIQDVLNSNLN